MSEQIQKLLEDIRNNDDKKIILYTIMVEKSIVYPKKITKMILIAQK